MCSAALVGPGVVRMDALRVGRTAAPAVLLAGRFEPTAEAMLLTRARPFQYLTTVTARFSSLFAGDRASDLGALAWPGELAIRFGCDAAIELRALSFDAFPASSPQELASLLSGIARTGGVGSDALEAHLASFPDARRFVEWHGRFPVSYATMSYQSLDTYVLPSREREKAHLRFRFEPVAGEHYFQLGSAGQLSPDYLSREMHRRLDVLPATFRMSAQFAGGGDRSDRPDLPWPSDRGQVALGTMTLTDLSAVPWATHTRCRPPDGLEVVEPSPTRLIDSLSFHCAGEVQ